MVRRRSGGGAAGDRRSVAVEPPQGIPAPPAAHLLANDLLSVASRLRVR
jgi:hypothetical protein